MYLRRRLGRLESLQEVRDEGFTEDEEERVRSEALSRVTDEDLELVWEYLKRTEEEEGEPTPEELAAIERYFQVRRAHGGV